MGKRSIPAVPKSSIGTDRAQFDGAIKENLEVVLGQRVEPIQTLAPTATNAQIIAKLNEIINRLQ